MSNQERVVEVIDKRTVFAGHFQIDHYHLRHTLHAGGMSGTLSRELFERGQVAVTHLVAEDGGQCGFCVPGFAVLNSATK